MDFKKLLKSFDAVENQTSVRAEAIQQATGSIGAILESFNRLENNEIVEAEKPDFLDIDGDGDTEESMKKAAKDKEDKDKANESVEEGNSHSLITQIRNMAKKVEKNPDGKQHQIFAQTVESDLIDLFQMTRSEEVRNLIRQNKKAQRETDLRNANNIAITLWNIMNSNESFDNEPKEELEEAAAHSEWKVGIGKKTYTVTARTTYEAHKKAQKLADKENNLGGPGKIEKVQKELDEAIMISAEGSEAEALLQILKLSGMPAPVAPALPEPEQGPMEPSIDMQDEYANSPDEFEQDIDSVIASGNDLHRDKDQFAATAPGDNPMRAFEGRFKSILDELLAEDK